MTSPHEGLVVVLRQVHDEDVPAIARACDDADTARFIPGMPSPYTEADARAYLTSQRRKWREGTVYSWAIGDAAGSLLGMIDLHVGKGPAVGYWVAPAARGRGIATRAVETLTAWALGAGGFERLELTTHPENRASQRVAEKAGFTREGLVAGYVQTPDGPRDSVVFSRTRHPARPDTSGL